MTKKFCAGIFANAILFIPSLHAQTLVKIAGPFQNPVQAVHTRKLGLCIVEQKGRILCEGRLFLDISAHVTSGGERGLLSMAPAPDFDQQNSSVIYLNYTATVQRRLFTMVSELPVTGGRAEPGRMRTVLQFEQPYANHNGGLLLFGPDRLLYIGTGDGGSGGDPHQNGQKKSTMLGKILRIDPVRGRPYRLPVNPLAKSGYLPEIFATGLRNPWRFSFDRKTGLLFAGDVGQNRMEEIDVVRAGDNLGWSIMEGTECFRQTSCDRQGLTMPIFTYGRSEGQSVTGGYVYRGSNIPALRGHYIFGDFVKGIIRAFPVDDSGRKTGPVRTLFENAGNVSSFGEDLSGELLVVTYGGSIYRMEK
jgi:glucose/arabinose dehydrogenase